MSIGKPRGRAGKVPVWVYDKRAQRKVYVGQADNVKAARRLEALKDEEINGNGPKDQGWTVDKFAQHFLDTYHGKGTTRPEPTTYAHNESSLRGFRKEHGRKRLDSITREDAHTWTAQHPHQAKVIAAMFAEAVDKHGLKYNPFQGLGKRSRGRADITPLTEDAVDALATIAERTKGLYGPELAAMIRFAAWTGLRTGEVCALEWSEVDLGKGVVFVEWQTRNDGSRVKTKTKENRVVVLADEALQALQGLPRSRKHVFASPTGKPLRPNSIRHYWNPVRTAFTAELPMDHWLIRRLRHNPDDALDWYELRHRFGSMLADRGLSARDIADQMGNSPRVCEEVYIHAFEGRSQERVRQALNQQPTVLRPVEAEEKAS